MADKLVRFKHAELRAEAERVALRAALTGKANPSERQPFMGMAARLVRRLASIGLQSIPWSALRTITKSSHG